MYEILEPTESTMYANDSDFDTDEDKNDYYQGLGMFEGDPDMLYRNETDVSSITSYESVITYFLIDRDNHEILVSEMPNTAEEEEFLQAFALGNATLTDDQSWDAVKQKGLYIAYRGGSGYSYTIYKPNEVQA